jgi:RNA polymerase sigma-70 factor (ECF subfamily)
MDLPLTPATPAPLAFDAPAEGAPGTESPGAGTSGPEAPPAAAPDAPAVRRQPFRVLLERVKAGSEEAARELQAQYGDYIIKAVRRSMPRLLRTKFDSDDFAQDVWASYFRAPVCDFNGPDHLAAYLMRMAQNKVVDAARNRIETQKHDITREEPLAQFEDGQQRQKIYARDGTPSQAAISHEMWEAMLDGQRPVYREVLLMLRDGYNQIEVAERFKLTRRTVQRILDRALEKMHK